MQGLSFCEYAIRHLTTRSHLRISRRVSPMLRTDLAISTSETASRIRAAVIDGRVF
jgi:hypothetical protein